MRFGRVPSLYSLATHPFLEPVAGGSVLDCVARLRRVACVICTRVSLFETMMRTTIVQQHWSTFDRCPEECKVRRAPLHFLGGVGASVIAAPLLLLEVH